MDESPVSTSIQGSRKFTEEREQKPWDPVEGKETYKMLICGQYMAGVLTEAGVTHTWPTNDQDSKIQSWI